MNEPAAAPAAEAADPDLHGRTVWAIDTLSRIYQLFHALPEMAAPDGTPVSAVFGFTRDLLDIIENRRPHYLFCAIDAPGPTFRHEKFAAYKANRPDMPADLVPQIPLIRRLLDVMGIPCLERPGFEADDLLATLATRTVARGGDCIIATSDKDARQLLGDHVRLYNLRTNLPFGAAELRAEWGIAPGQVVDFLSLVGDAVDNVPGVPGIGPKIAGELLQQHGTLDDLLAHGATPSLRLRGLWVLWAIRRIDEPGLLALLDDTEPNIRAWGVRLLADAWPIDTVFGGRPSPEPRPRGFSLDALERLAIGETDPEVRLAVACALARLPPGKRAGVAAALVARDHEARRAPPPAGTRSWTPPRPPPPRRGGRCRPPARRRW
jgi:5'-3' exonuclease